MGQSPRDMRERPVEPVQFATSIPSSAPCKISCVHLNFHDPTSIQPVLLWVIGMSEDISAHHAPLIPLFFSLPSRQCLALRPSDSFLVTLWPYKTSTTW